MPLPDFHVSDPFTLGIELELQVVNPPGYDLSQDSPALIADLAGEIKSGEVKHDITESMLEIATGVCGDVHQAHAQLSAIQHSILRVAAGRHVGICGGGTHPFQQWQRQEVCASERYQHTLDMFGYLVRQSTIFGQHVHIGCRNGDDAIYLLHGLSRFVPHFIALNAASPWLQGVDSGFECVRPNLFSAFPDNGPMPWVANWDAFRRLFRQLSYTGMIESIKDLHWDIRPSPHFGTVEVRVMDTPLTLGRAISMAGFIQTLSHWLLATRPFKHQPEDYLLYKFNRYQACRFGLQGTLTDVHTGEQRSIVADLSALLEKLDAFTDTFHATSALDDIARQIKTADSEAQRMRNFVSDGGSLIGLVQRHCEIWATD